jgi:Tol biopolymer transport system component
VTDRGEKTNFETLRYGSLRLGVLDVATREVRTYAPFEDAKHINPQYSADGKSLYFISDPDGFSDIYRIDLATEEVFQVTRVATGVSGLTSVSPALTVAPSTGRLLFSVFEGGKMRMYGLEEARGSPPERGGAPGRGSAGYGRRGFDGSGGGAGEVG